MKASADGAVGFRYRGPYDAEILRRLQTIVGLTMVTVQRENETVKISAMLPGTARYSSHVNVAGLAKYMSERGEVESLF